MKLTDSKPTETLLSNFGTHLNIAIVGASGGLGSAFVRQLSKLTQVKQLFAFSRAYTSLDSDLPNHPKISRLGLDLCSEQQIQQQVSKLKGNPLDLVIVCAGLLHTEQQGPEKSMRTLSMEHLEAIFRVNTFGPTLFAKHCLPLLHTERKSVFAILSARVGSISDNHLGGWYSYRASKAALNMMLKTLAIETNRKNKRACIVGLHPGTVDTHLSKPFQRQVPKHQLFSPKQSVTHLLDVINHLDPSHTGEVFAWDGQRILP